MCSLEVEGVIRVEEGFYLVLDLVVFFGVIYEIIFCCFFFVASFNSRVFLERDSSGLGYGKWFFYLVYR